MTSPDLLVVANRLPATTDGTLNPEGLLAALLPDLRSRNGKWVGWPGVPGAEAVASEVDGVTLQPVPLGNSEVQDYYEGFSNATLWPLYHDVLQRPVFDRRWWDAYMRVNRRFAETAAAVATEGATVWVHDYHLQLVPVMVRELRPDLRIGFFLDTPFPPVELFMRLPWRTEIVRGLLGADLIGFHRPGGAQNFLFLARRLVGLEPSRGAVGVRTRPGVITVGDRQLRVGAFPGSIDSVGIDAISRKRETTTRAQEIRASLGNPRTIMLGVEHLDHTKGMDQLNYSMGIDLKLQAVHELIAEDRIPPEEIVTVQVAHLASRDDARHHHVLRRDIERIASRINNAFAGAGRPIVHYVQQPMSRAELVAFYLAADVLVATPLREGMNFTAKEYVASRHDLGGAVVLSEFSGTSAELTSAFLVNPFDLGGLKDAMHASATVDPAEQRRRMRALRRQVLTHDSDRWKRSFLDHLEHSQDYS